VTQNNPQEGLFKKEEVSLNQWDVPVILIIFSIYNLFINQMLAWLFSKLCTPAL
jgi:hypothetical protein